MNNLEGIKPTQPNRWKSGPLRTGSAGMYRQAQQLGDATRTSLVILGFFVPPITC